MPENFGSKSAIVGTDTNVDNVTDSLYTERRPSFAVDGNYRVANYKSMFLNPQLQLKKWAQFDLGKSHKVSEIIISFNYYK